MWPKFERVRHFMHILVTCKYIKDRIKISEKRWRHHFPHYKSMFFLLPWKPEFWSNLPQNLMQPFPPPHKFDQDWPTGLRDIQVQKCEIFVTEGQVPPKWMVWFGPKSNSTKLLCLSWFTATLMMIRSKMNELAWRQHFPIISLWDFFRRSRAANSVDRGPI